MTYRDFAVGEGERGQRRLPLRWFDLVLIGVFGVLGVQAAVVFSLARGWIAPFGAGGSEAQILAAIAILAVQAAGLLAVVLLVAIRMRGVSWAALGFRHTDPHWYIKAGLVVAGGIALSGLNTLVVQGILGEAPQNPQLQVIAPDGFSWTGLIGMTLVAGGIVPIAEEITFRSVLYRWLRERIGFWPGIVISSVLFGVLHGVLFLAPVLSILGALFAWLYERSGSIWPAIAAHGLFNTVMVVGVYVSLAAGYPVT